MVAVVVVVALLSPSLALSLLGRRSRLVKA
jgi:hypothetical protein